MPRPEPERGSFALTVEPTPEGRFCVVLHVHLSSMDCVAVQGNARYSSYDDAYKHGYALLQHMAHVIGQRVDLFTIDEDPKRRPN